MKAALRPSLALLHALNGTLLRRDLSPLSDHGEYGERLPCGKLRTAPSIVRILRADLSRNRKLLDSRNRK